tara:strand:+ start:325 stop:588 length:264 start_codon:yes stop_codon:yes gene_type:complete
MKKLYIQARSKADLNRRIIDGEDVFGVEYNIFNQNGYITRHYLKNIRDDCIIAIYNRTRLNEDNLEIPIPHIWGTFKPTSGGGAYIY